MKKSVLSLILALFLLMGLAVPAVASEAEAPIIILHTNDVHGRAVADPASGAMGYAAIAQRKEDLEGFGAAVLLLDAGDATQGMPVVNMSMGETAIEFMNATDYMAMTPGNHEFDWGLENLLKLRESMEFPILCANIVDKTSGAAIFEPYAVFEVGGKEIGVFGLDTPETLTKTHPDKIAGIDFLQGDALYACAQAQIDALEEEGCDLIICLGHLGVDDESAPNRSIDVIENTDGIDLFIDGHSHTEFPAGEVVDEALLVSTGSHSQNIGEVRYENDTLTARLYKNEDPEVKAEVDAVNAEVTEQLAAVFATTEVDLNGEREPGVRTEETNLGDFAADALLWSAQQAVSDDVVAAVTNGGGIRASIPAGEISMNNMKEVFPYGNEVAVLTLTGAELLEALEAAVFSLPEATGAFPQVAGLEFAIDTTVPYEDGEQYPDSTYFAPKNPGARITISTVGGEAFDPAARYTIATNDFTAAGGDTYYAFRAPYAATGYATGISLEDALVSYVTDVLGGAISTNYAEPQGRITIK